MKQEANMPRMKLVTIYTDGACSGNPGPGGWGAILAFSGVEKELSGYDPATTNNRMELMAAIEALRALKEPCRVELYSDSAYLCNAFLQRWLVAWQERGWRKADKQPVENRDLWEILVELTDRHSVRFIKVKGHADNVFNNRCDALARAAIRAKVRK